MDVVSVESCMQNWFQNFEILFVTLVPNIFNFVQSVNKHFGKCGYVLVQSPSTAQVEVPLALCQKPKSQAIA